MNLQEAIAEVQRVTRIDDECGQGSMWTGDDFTCAQPEHDPAAIDHAIAAVLNAVASGDLIPKTDAEAEVARLQRLVKQMQGALWFADEAGNYVRFYEEMDKTPFPQNGEKALEYLAEGDGDTP